jgi:hypothetical protein
MKTTSEKKDMCAIINNMIMENFRTVKHRGDRPGMISVQLETM